MTDILQAGIAALGAARKAHASTAVVYGRGAASVALRATVGRTLFEAVGGDGVVENIESRDYLVETADLVLDGLAALPQPGDRIAQTVGGAACVFEVMAVGGEPCYRWSDPYRQTLRIHTKLVEETP